MLCQFERLIYPQSVRAIDAGSFMIAVYRPCEKIKDSAGDLVTQVKAVGYGLPIADKQRYELQGHWSKNPKHGVQFEVETYDEVITPTREGIIAYLSSGQIKGIGPKMAEKIFDAFGLTALEVLDKEHRISAENIRQGVADCFWAGRMEEVLPEVYVDGAHNEDGIRAFLETVQADGRDGNRSLLFSVVKEKDYEQMIEELVKSGLFGRFAIAHMQTGRAVTLDRLERIFREYPQCEYVVYDTVTAAFHALLQSRRKEERIYVAGSLYLVGEIKELLENDKF